MANFLQTGQQPLSPYISQINPDAYLRIGMMKQEQYNQGVQKIQSAIDNVGGLDIVNPYAQQYYKQQFDQMRGKVQSLAGGDFSNSAIVNQISGVASGLAKDEIIQNAVLSSQQIRALQKSQQEKEQKGDYAPQAKWFDNTFVNHYTQNTDLKTKYVGPTTATNYLDHNKELQAYLKDLAPDVTYSVNENGNVVMSTIKSTSLGDLKIRQAVEGFYNDHPQFKQSAMIDAEYLYQGITPEELNKTRQAMKLHFGAQYEETKAQLLQDKKVYSNDLGKIQEINAKLAEAQLNYEYSIKELSTDDNVKYNMYNEHVINNAIVKYQKAAELDEKETVAGKNYLDYLKVGLKQRPDGSITPITPADADWVTYQHIQKKQKQDGEGGGGKPISIAVPGQEGSILTADIIDQRTTEIEKEIENIQLDLHNSRPNDTTKADTERYIADQENKLKNGQPVDKEYMKYRQQVSPLIVQKNTLSNTLQETTNNADIVTQTAIKGINKKIEGIKDQQTGQRYTLELHGKQNQDFLQDLYTIQEVINNRPKLPLDPTPYDRKVYGEELLNYNNKVNSTIRSYQNNHNYKHYLNIINSGKLDETIISYSEALSENSKLINQNLEKSSLASDAKLYTFTEKEINNGDYKSQILTALSQKGGDASIPDEKKITPVGHFISPIDNNYYLTYKIEGDDKMQKVMIPGKTGEGEIPDYDSFAWLKKAVDSSPKKQLKTPLYTSNGLISYTIGWDHLSKEYKMQLALPDGMLVNVLSDVGRAPHPGEIMMKAEQFSLDRNPYTQKPYTREEINYGLTHTPEEFQIWMQNQQK